MADKFYIGQRAADYLAELNNLHQSVQSVVDGQVVVTCTATSSPGIVSGQNLRINLSGTSLLSGGNVASFKIDSWAGLQTVAATGNAATLSIAATGAVGAVLTYTVRAVDNYGNMSRAVVNTVNVVNNGAPTGAFPAGFYNAWKAVDNTYISIPTIKDFGLFYKAMADQGSINFAHAQALKTTLNNADTLEDVEAIVW